MKKIAFLFSGQGSQYPGMGKELYENFPSARAVFECGSDMLGFDLAKTCFEGEEATLAQTKISQPAIFAVSMAAHSVVSQLCTPCAVAGHSLGEYAALTAAGVFTLEDGFRVIGARAAAMQLAAEQNPGSMFAIIGSDEQTITEVCAQTQGYVIPVNFNAPAQTVIAGEVAAAQQAADQLSAQGAKAVKLAVSSAFHSKLMACAAQAFQAEISSVKTAAPKYPFYSNVTAKRLPADTDLPQYLAEHLVSPVYFHQEISELIAQEGVEQFVELGPNKVLTMLIKRSFKQVDVNYVENLKTFEKFRASAQ